MSLRPCECWAIHRRWWGRLRELLRYGHARHVCVVRREFCQVHEGDHVCHCGVTWEYDELAQVRP